MNNELNSIIEHAPLAIASSRIITIILFLCLVVICIKIFHHCKNHRNITKLFTVGIIIFTFFGFSLCNYHENKMNYNLARFDRCVKASHNGYVYNVSKLNRFNYF